MSTVKTLKLGDRDLEIRMNRRVASALEEVANPLWIEMELDFNCMVAKRVNFVTGTPPADSVARAAVNDRVNVCFRAIMTRTCLNPADAQSAQIETRPVKQAQAYLPKWLTLDFRRGVWTGEFGY